MYHVSTYHVYVRIYVRTYHVYVYIMSKQGRDLQEQTLKLNRGLLILSLFKVNGYNKSQSIQT